MTTCPNCGQPIADTDKFCPNCRFNLQKYRDTFFSDEHQQARYENEETGKKIVSRKIYRQEFYPEKQNLIVQRMLEWIRANSMIVFLLGILLLLVMSFSRSIGWISFFALLIWLYLVCTHDEKIERYTVDKRLTEKLNQVASNMFNNVEETKEKSKFASHSRRQAGETADVKRHFNYVQLLVVLMAAINLIVMFAGSGASVVDVAYTGKMSITRVIFNLAGRLFSSGTTFLSGILLCIIWLLIVLIPLLVIYGTLKGSKKDKLFAFILSLIETIFLAYLILRIVNGSPVDRGFLNSITRELLLYAVSIGTSTYFLILASFMTTVLAGYNLFSKKYRKQ